MSKSLPPFYFAKRGVVMADVDELQIKINAEATKANNAIDRLVGKLDRLTTSLSKVNGTNLNGLANGVQRLGNAMQVMNTIKTADFTRLATNLTKLGTVNVSALNSAASSMSHLTRAFNSLGTVSDNAQSVGEMAKNISKLGNKSVQTAIANIPQLAKAVNNLMTTLSKSPKVSQNVIKMTNALANLASQTSKVGGASKSVVTGLNKTSASADKAKKSFSGLAYAFGKFYANFFLLVRAFKQLGNAVENSMNYVETYNYFKVALDKIGKEFSKSYERFGYDNAEDYANSFTSRLAELNEKMTGYKLGEDGELIDTGKIGLGLDPRQIMSFQANIASITNSVGLLGETSINSAKGLSMLAQDLSSLFNVDLKTTMQNLASGLIGQSRALYKYGIDITNATLQQIAYANGVTKSVSAMTQAEKMQLRLIAILQQSKIAWTDSIQTINTAANQFRILKQQIANLSRTIGNLFLPIVQKILPVISGLVIAINRLLTGLGVKLFGADWLKNLNKDTSQGSSEFVDLGDAIEDTDDSMQEAQKSAEKLKRSLMGFDEINQLSPKTDDTDTGTDLGNVGGVDLTDTIGDLLAEYEDAWNKAFEKMVNDAEKWADRIEEIFKRPEEAGRKLNIAITNALNSIPWDSIYEGARNFGTGLAQFLNGLISPDLFYAVGRTIANSLNTAIYTALSFGETFDWSNLGESIASGINGFFENFDFSSLATTINDFVHGIGDLLDSAIGNIDWKNIFSKIFDFLGELDPEVYILFFGTKLLRTFSNVMKNLVIPSLAKNIGSDIANAIRSAFSGEAVAGAVESGATTLGATISSVLSVIGGIGLEFGGLSAYISSFLDMVNNGFSGFKEVMMLAGVAVTAFGAILLGTPAAVALAVGGIVALVSTLVAKISEKSQLFRNIVSGTLSVIKSNIDAYINFTLNSIKAHLGLIADLFRNAIDLLVNTISTFFNDIDRVLGDIQDVFSNTISFVKNIFAGNWKNAWQDVVNIFKSTFGLIADVAKTPINAVINLINGLISAVESGVNYVIRMINGLSFDVPDWVPGIGSKHFGFNLSTVSAPRIPTLATGGYVDSGQLFIARENGLPEMVGSIGGQTAVANNEQIIQGIQNGVASAITNAVVPYLVQIVNKDTTIQLDGREVGRASVNYINGEKRRGAEPLLGY